MSSKLGEAFVPVRATLDKLDGDLKEAKSKIQGALDGIKSGVQNLGKIALGGLVLGVGALGTAMFVAGGHAIDLGADANETASLLETSLGPAAERLNGTLAEFSDQANRSFYELQQGSSTFVAMTRSMGATEDQAADLAIGFTEAATDLGSFFNVATEDALLDIQSALAGSSETLTKYGIDIRETTLKQMALDQGLISTASETLPQLVRAQLIQQAITEQGADAMGDAIRTSDSWSNTMRGLKGRLRDLATAAGQKLIPALMPILNIVGDLAERAMPFFNDVLDDVIPVIEKVAGVFETFVTNLQSGMSPIMALKTAIWELFPPEIANRILEIVDTIQNLWRGFQNLFEAQSFFEDDPPWLMSLKEFGDIARPIIQSIIDTVTNFVEWKDVAIAFAIAIGSVVIPIIWSILSPILAVIAVGAALVAAVALIRTAWEENWGGIREKTAAVAEFITNAIQSIKDWWAANGDAILAKAQATWEAVKDAVRTAITVARNIIQTTIAAIRSFWAEHGDAILAKGREVWTSIQTAIDDAITAVQAIIRTVATAIQRFWSEHGDAILESARNAWEMIKKAVDDAITLIKSIFATFKSAFEGDWSAFGENLRQLWEDAWKLITDFIGGLWNTIKPLLSELWQSIQDWWSGIDWASLGQRIIDGIVNGLRNAAGAIYDFIMEIAQNALDAILGFFGLGNNNQGGPGSGASNFPPAMAEGWQAALSRGGMNGRLTLALENVNIGFSPVQMGERGGAPLTLYIDARNSTDPQEVRRQVERAVDAALRRAGVTADYRIRTR